MRATIMFGAGDVRVEMVPDTNLSTSTDAFVRVTHAATLAAASGTWLAVPSAGTQRTGATKDLGRRTSQYPASTGRVLLLVVTALLVLTQLYAAIPLAGTVGDHIGGNATFALSGWSAETVFGGQS